MRCRPASCPLLPCRRAQATSQTTSQTTSQVPPLTLRAKRAVYLACFCKKSKIVRGVFLFPIMNPDDRPVHIRTSASAIDFWCRVRDDSKESEGFSPDGKTISKRSSFLNNSDTPFGRQNKPGSLTSSSFANNNTFFATASPTTSVTAPHINVMSSREVERLVFNNEIHTLEPKSTKNQWEKDNEALRRALITTKQHLKLTLQVNRALAQANAKLTVVMAAGISK